MKSIEIGFIILTHCHYDHFVEHHGFIRLTGKPAAPLRFTVSLYQGWDLVARYPGFSCIHPRLKTCLAAVWVNTIGWKNARVIEQKPFCS